MPDSRAPRLYPDWMFMCTHHECHGISVLCLGSVPVSVTTQAGQLKAVFIIGSSAAGYRWPRELCVGPDSGLCVGVCLEMLKGLSGLGDPVAILCTSDLPGRLDLLCQSWESV